MAVVIDRSRFFCWRTEETWSHDNVSERKMETDFLSKLGAGCFFPDEVESGWAASVAVVIVTMVRPVFQ